MNISEDKLTVFAYNGEATPVRFVETMAVKEGVECDTYVFSDDATKDLAIVSVQKGYKTPLQRVLLGDKTIEGFVAGQGTLTVYVTNKASEVYSYKDGGGDKPITVQVGQLMQWHADGDSDLTFYEICEPPYQDGRFENLVEQSK